MIHVLTIYPQPNRKTGGRYSRRECGPLERVNVPVIFYPGEQRTHREEGGLGERRRNFSELIQDVKQQIQEAT